MPAAKQLHPQHTTPEPAAVGKTGAAAILGVSISWIEHHLAEVPSFNIGRRRMFSVEALHEWVREKAASSNGKG